MNIEIFVVPIAMGIGAGWVARSGGATKGQSLAVAVSAVVLAALPFLLLQIKENRIENATMRAGSYRYVEESEVLVRMACCFASTMISGMGSTLAVVCIELNKMSGMAPELERGNRMTLRDSRVNRMVSRALEHMTRGPIDGSSVPGEYIPCSKLLSNRSARA